MKSDELEAEFSRTLLDNREIYLSGEIDREMVCRFHKMMAFLNARGREEIGIYINSGGGSVAAGLDIYDAIRTSKAPTRGIVFSEAASMAIVALQGCNKRVAMEHACFYFHFLKIRLFKEWPEFKEEMERELEEIKNRQEEIWRIFSRRGADVERIKKICGEKRLIFSEEAKEIGIIDEVI